jgi:uncharacterized protein YneF (UPF0154 family)
MIKTQLFIAFALLAGACIGFCLAPREEKNIKDNPQVQEETSVKTSSIVDKGEQASVSALRSRIKSLENELAKEREKNALKGTNSEEAVASTTENHSPNVPRFSKMMENLKKENPEQFKNFMRQVEDFRRIREARAKAKLNFFDSIDTSMMSTEAAKTHNELKELVARNHELEAELMQEDLSDERRGEIFRELASTRGKMRHLNKVERDNLLGAVAKAVGLEGESASDLVSTVNQIVDSTDDSFVGHGAHRRRRGR